MTANNSNISDLINQVDSSSNKNVNDVITNCDPAVRPIFPVRFSITPKKLGSLAKISTEKCTVEQNMTTLGDGYELRRLRQGYIYLYAQKTFHEDETSDQEGIWKVFKYVTEKDDENASTKRDDVIDKNEKRQSFHCYTWIDGHAGGVWKDVDSKVYPYAFVSLDTSIAHIAYSEERWPAWFFQQCQTDSSFRKEIMQEVNLLVEQTDYSCKLDLLAEKVVDFMPSLIEEIVYQYAAMHTGLQHEPHTSVSNCKHTETEGRIIALHDPIGKILDIDRRLTLANHERLNYAAQSQYPLTIAKLVDQIKPSLDESWSMTKGIFDEHPIRGEQWQEYLNDEVAYQSEVENLITAYDDTLKHQHVGDLGKLLAKSLEGLPEKTNKQSDIERLTFATTLMERSIRNIDSSYEGGQMLLASWKNEPHNSNLILRKYLSSIASYWSKALDIKLKQFEVFDLLIKSSATQLAQIAIKQPNNVALKAITHLTEVTRISHVPVATEQVSDIFTGKSAKGLVFAKYSETEVISSKIINGESKLSTQMDGNSHTASTYKGTTASSSGVKTTQSSVVIGSRKIDSLKLSVQKVNMLHLETAGYATPAAGFHTAARDQFSSRLASAGVSTFLGYYTLFDLIDKRNVASKATTDIGRLGDSFCVKLAVQLSDSLAASYTMASKLSTSQSAQQLSKNLSAKLAEEIAKKNLVSKATAKSIGNSAKGIGMARAALVAKCAGYFTAVLSLIKAGDAFYSDKNAVGVGNLLMGIGGVVMIYLAASGIGIAFGLVLIIVGGFIEMFGGLSELEQWAKDCFWGSSDKYWDTDRQDLSITDFLEKSTFLSDFDDPQHEEVKGYFEDEVFTFEELFLSFNVSYKVFRSFAYEINLPRANEGAYKLNIKMLLSYDTKPNKFYGLMGDVIDDYPLVNFDYVIDESNNKVKVNFRRSLPKDIAYINKVVVIASYTDPNNKEYPEIDKIIYNRTKDQLNNYKWKV
jgi:hypothetical protein